MRRLGAASTALVAVGTIATAVAGVARPAEAHPTPFTFLDVRVQSRTSERLSLEVSLVAHIIDVAHDLNIDPPERLYEAAVLEANRSRMAALINERLRFQADGRLLQPGPWAAPEALPERQSISFSTRYELDNVPSVVNVAANLFPYDPQHQTFVNVYERDEVTTQLILNHQRTAYDYFTGSPGGIVAMGGQLVRAGLGHILRGPDHLIFLIGLLLVSGTIGRLVLAVTAFTLAHIVTLSLAALSIVVPSSRLVEPAIALSIVYLGVDNLMVQGGRDVRVWIALTFGLIHGFGVASVLRDMDLPRRALVWSLAFFNIGIEMGQVLVVVAVASLFALLRSRSERAGRHLAFAGSVVVMAAGTFWFIQRVFFPGGIS